MRIVPHQRLPRPQPLGRQGDARITRSLAGTLLLPHKQPRDGVRCTAPRGVGQRHELCREAPRSVWGRQLCARECTAERARPRTCTPAKTNTAVMRGCSLSTMRRTACSEELRTDCAPPANWSACRTADTTDGAAKLSRPSAHTACSQHAPTQNTSVHCARAKAPSCSVATPHCPLRAACSFSAVLAPCCSLWLICGRAESEYTHEAESAAAAARAHLAHGPASLSRAPRSAPGSTTAPPALGPMPVAPSGRVSRCAAAAAATRARAHLADAVAIKVEAVVGGVAHKLLLKSRTGGLQPRPRHIQQRVREQDGRAGGAPVADAGQALQAAGAIEAAAAPRQQAA